MDWSSPGSSVHGILHERIMEWVAIPFSRRKGLLIPILMPVHFPMNFLLGVFSYSSSFQVSVCFISFKLHNSSVRDVINFVFAGL